MTEIHGVDGITFLDHTADVGIDVRAPSLELLFHRAAVGMLMLLQGRDEPDEADAGETDAGETNAGETDAEPAGERDEAGTGAPTEPEGASLEGPTGVETLTIELEADDTAELLADWLKELHFLHETRHADYARATFDRLGEDALEARVQTEPAAPAVREIKGVTHHELAVERSDGDWTARVIFDV